MYRSNSLRSATFLENTPRLMLPVSMLPLIATPFLLIDVIAYSRSSLLSLLGSI
ncbi:hypothetical protein L798_13761 [Zootermopsis nevadensis]|uniref:Uncharacterized protein n=1 Tax=Zootermopsis nevadensis TaxID=136037 RepID=A0A067QRV4_ZOONE|nr:hypothetical protein L798_13761 [Zootermopsis nevadensis]